MQCKLVSQFNVTSANPKNSGELYFLLNCDLFSSEYSKRNQVCDVQSICKDFYISVYEPRNMLLIFMIDFGRFWHRKQKILCKKIIDSLNSKQYFFVTRASMASFQANLKKFHFPLFPALGYIYRSCLPTLIDETHLQRC